jgi:hypothetical protein
MAGLNSNVTLGPGVVPIAGQLNVPASGDEISFGDAFAEAQATGLDSQNAIDSPASQARSAAADLAGSPGSAPVISYASSTTTSHIWQSVSRSNG